MGIGHLLNRTVEVWRLARAKDDVGGWVESLYLHHSEPFRIAPASAAERQIGDKEEAQVTHAGYGLGNSTVSRGDHLRAEGLDFEVLYRLPPSKPSHHLKVLLHEVQVAASTASLTLPEAMSEADGFGEPEVSE